MTVDLRDFWRRFQSGLEVAVASNVPEKLFGVRDAFQRFFHESLDRRPPISVHPVAVAGERDAALPLDDTECLELARRHAREVEAKRSQQDTFTVGVELGLATVEAGDEVRSFVRCWAVIFGLGDEAWGSGGSIELPNRLVQGIDHNDLPYAIPGTRRRGGMVSTLTGGLESRRTAVSLAAFHALSTLMYSIVESRPRTR